MKISIEKRPADKLRKQSLRLIYNLPSSTDSDGKKIRKRFKETLSIFLFSEPKTKEERNHNKEMMRLAETIKAKRLIELDARGNALTDPTKGSGSFFDYYDSQTNLRIEASKSNHSVWVSAGKQLRRFVNRPDLSFLEVTPEFLEGFKAFLKKAKLTKSQTLLSNNTQNAYFNKIRAALNQAHKEGIIRDNPVSKVASVKLIANKREYLTVEELRNIAKTECRYDVLRRAFLFSCLTGLRWSDIQKLTWRDVQAFRDGYRIVFNQKKTGGLQYLDLTQQAYGLMGQPDLPKERVFKGLRYSSWHNVALVQWACRAGISKHITFHSGRHTFAVIQLTQGTDIYTLSKLLGHSELKTTQIYADIIEKTRIKAMNAMPDIF